MNEFYKLQVGKMSDESINKLQTCYFIHNIRRDIKIEPLGLHHEFRYIYFKDHLNVHEVKIHKDVKQFSQLYQLVKKIWSTFSDSKSSLNIIKLAEIYDFKIF